MWPDEVPDADMWTLRSSDGAIGEERQVERGVTPHTVARDGEHLITTSWFANLGQVWDPVTGQAVERYDGAGNRDPLWVNQILPSQKGSFLRQSARDGGDWVGFSARHFSDPRRRDPTAFLSGHAAGRPGDSCSPYTR